MDTPPPPNERPRRYKLRYMTPGQTTIGPEGLIKSHTDHAVPPRGLPSSPPSRPKKKTAGDLPPLSITLPRNFTFHYKDPKTPDRELPSSSSPTLFSPPPAFSARPPTSSPSHRAYRIRRRTRPSIFASSLYNQSGPATQDIALPTVEAPTWQEPTRRFSLRRISHLGKGYLASSPSRPRAATLPRTPSGQRTLTYTDMENTPGAYGASVARPPSPTSESALLSTSEAYLSSSDSNDSDNSMVADKTSCVAAVRILGNQASPVNLQSDARRRSQAIRRRSQASRRGSQAVRHSQTRRNLIPFVWLSEMDSHLWRTYEQFSQDPRVTPWKMAPGKGPPPGVAHRVAEQALETWMARHDSTSAGSWPKSQATVRRRLHKLCEARNDIPMFYTRIQQQMYGDRGPSPLSASSRSASRSLNDFGSSQATPRRPSSFSTRDFQLSLTTSTASTMQPNGPLARLAQDTTPFPHQSQIWSNDAAVPFASPAPMLPAFRSDADSVMTVSDGSFEASTTRFGTPIEATVPYGGFPQASQRFVQPLPHGLAQQSPFGRNTQPVQAFPNYRPRQYGEFAQSSPFAAFHIPRLGSPLTFQTWGPVQSQPTERSVNPVRMESDDEMDGGESRRRTSAHLHQTYPGPANHKRRAQHDLEHELSPSGSNLRQAPFDPFGVPKVSTRRVRTRALSVSSDSMSLDAAPIHGFDMGQAAPIRGLDMRPDNYGHQAMNTNVWPTHLPPPKFSLAPMLNSPIAGIAVRNTRVRAAPFNMQRYAAIDGSFEVKIHPDDADAFD